MSVLCCRMLRTMTGILQLHGPQIFKWAGDRNTAACSANVCPSGFSAFFQCLPPLACSWLHFAISHLWRRTKWKHLQAETCKKRNQLCHRWPGNHCQSLCYSVVSYLLHLVFQSTKITKITKWSLPTSSLSSESLAASASFGTFHLKFLQDFYSSSLTP